MADYEDFEQEEISREEQRRRMVLRTMESGVLRQDPAFLEREKLRRRDRLRDFLIGLSLSAVFLLFMLFYYRNYSYTTYSLNSETTLGALSEAKIRKLDSGNVIIGGDTITYMEKGVTVWSTAVDLKKPVVAVNGDFFSVYDTGGYQVYVCDKTGILCTLKVSRMIHGMDISADGVVAVFTESDDAEYISYFDRYGSRIPVDIKSVLSGTGQPMRIAISPDSQKLAVLYYTTANGIGESRMVLYDFEKGREEDSFIVHSDSSFYGSGTLLVDGRFLDNGHFAAVGTNLAKFYSYDQKKGETTEKTLEYACPVRSVWFAGDTFLLIDEREDGNLCTVYDMTGEYSTSFEVPREYGSFAVNDEQIAFMNGRDLTVYNLSGRKRYEGTLIDTPLSFAYSGKRSLLLNTGSLIEEITLK